MFAMNGRADFARAVNYERKILMKSTPGLNVIKLFLVLTKRPNKRQHLSLAKLSAGSSYTCAQLS